MARSIEIIIAPTGDIKIDALGFKGADCEKATAFLESALGVTGKKVKKPDYYATSSISPSQRVGQ